MVGCHKCDYTGIAAFNILCECTDVARELGQRPDVVIVEEYSIDAHEKATHYQNRGCSCHLGHPPCGYCTEGGYCTQHNLMRVDCGCEI